MIEPRAVVPTAPTTAPSPTPITIAFGDGIGPEIMEVTLSILREAGAQLDPEVIEIGESVYLRGNSAGIEAGAWESLRRTRVFLKAPITTPQGGGYKSLNVTVRKTLGLYANVRPCVSYHPFIATKHPVMNVVIVRENEEDVYGGIEHRQTDEVYQCLRLITRPGTEKIVRYAFEYARRHNRTKVTCFTKDNIMKMTDGLFHQVFDEIAAEYPEIAHEHRIVDIGAAKLADTPEAFDVVVLPNLYGDILSDVAAQIAGSVGLAGSANIGEKVAMFEAIHGSAPRRAGQDLANPSGMLLAGVLMLVHIGQPEIAERVHNAWLRTIEDGIHTYDIYAEDVSKEKVGTRAFANAVIARLGQQPERLTPVAYNRDAAPLTQGWLNVRPPAVKALVGVDVFLHWPERSPEVLGEQMRRLDGDGLRLSMITNRGTKVWPNGLPETFCTDHWRCRFMADDGVTNARVLALLQRVHEAGFDFVKTEHLYTFDGQAGYSLGQGQ
ncbi:MAG: NADP-dependent isocitrate dehydrogenase [Chloroflexi bacterium]|nr:NADP-dependent isocitrate dehydrogenase [Chloroflexota bacterium]